MVTRPRGRQSFCDKDTSWPLCGPWRRPCFASQILSFCGYSHLCHHQASLPRELVHLSQTFPCYARHCLPMVLQECYDPNLCEPSPSLGPRCLLRARQLRHHSSCSPCSCAYLVSCSTLQLGLPKDCLQQTRRSSTALLHNACSLRTRNRRLLLALLLLHLLFLDCRLRL